MRPVARFVVPFVLIVACDPLDHEPSTGPSQAPGSGAVRTSSQVSGAGAYEAIDLGTLGGVSSFAAAINDSGQIVGRSMTASGRTHAFRWENGVMRDLGGLAPDDNNQAVAINNAGLVAGLSGDAPRVVIWENGVIRDLGMADSPTAEVQTMNARGDVVGTPDRWDTYSPHAILWHDGVLQDLGWLRSSGGTYALAMNNRRQIVGGSLAYSSSDQFYYHPFLWENGVLRDLGVFGRTECENPQETGACAASGEATDINELGQIVGWSQDSAGFHRPFLWEDGRMRDLGIFPGQNVRPLVINERGQIAGALGASEIQGGFLWDHGVVQEIGSLGPFTAVLAMNDSGEIVGWSGSHWETSHHAYVWRDGVMYDLGLGPIGGTFSRAVAINARGDIVGYGGENFPYGPIHAILWRPVTAPPAPATIAQTLLTAGNNAVNQKVYTTASIAPAPNTLVTVAVLEHSSLGAPPRPTLSGGGMTAWDVVATTTFDTGALPSRRLTIFRAMSPTPGSGAITITSSMTLSHCQWIVSQWAGVETGGMNGAGAIRQTGSTRGTAVSGLTVPLAAFGHSNNVGYGVFGVRSSVLAVIPGAGFTEISEQPSGEGTPGDLEAEWATNRNTIAATWTKLNGGALGVEIKAGGSGRPVPDASRATVSAAPTAITAGTGSSAITVTVKDAGGNPMSGVWVVLSATGSGNTLTQPAGLTDAAGVATGTLSSTVAGTKTVSATADGTALTQRATVTVTAPPVSGTITQTLLTAGNNTLNQRVYVTGAIAPAPNTLVTVAVLAHSSLGTPPSPTLSGGGMTAWEIVATTTFDPGTLPSRRLTIFRAMSTAPGSGSITITSSMTLSHCQWIVSQWGAVETDGVNGAGAIGQTGSGLGDGVSGLTVSLAAFENPNNVAYGVFGVRSSVFAVAPGAGFTEISEQPSGEGTPGDLEAEWAANRNLINATWTKLNAGALGVEIKAGTAEPRPAFAAVSAGGWHACGVTPAGAGYCWGENGGGQLGDRTTTNRTSPTAVAGGLTFAAVSPGGYHTCGVTPAGAAYCWGGNDEGQLGDESFLPYRISPAAVAGGLTFATVSAGVGHTCGVTASGAAYCWGANHGGQLGDGTTTQRTSPTAVVGGLIFAAIDAGGDHTCGLTSAGAAYCWGGNSYGALGVGDVATRTSPVAVVGGLTFAAVSAGVSHTCGVTASGAAYCWGYNYDGQLGDGTTTHQTSPVAVVGGLTFATLSASASHTCGVTPAGAAYCWGGNTNGQLGDGTTTQRTSPTAVVGGLTFAAVTAGWYQSCGLTTEGAVYCWGREPAVVTLR